MNALIAALILLSAQEPGALRLAEGGRSDYRLVLPAEPIPSERHAAEEFRRFFKEMSGAELRVVSETDPPGKREICLNARGRIAAIDPGFARVRPGRDGFALRTKDSHLLILGDRPRGTLYAVYHLLEEELGCRWFTREVARIPKRDRWDLRPLDLKITPHFEYRETFWTEAFDGDWAARRRSNGNTPRLKEHHGGRIRYYPFVHTFNRILSPDRHFKEHPEYFSEIKGKRVGGRTQLCLTNPGVLRLSIETVRGWMRDHPEAKIFSVSQNDWHNYCTCEGCRAIDAREGSPSGSLLAFVNRIAEAVEKDFPGKLIDTLAYQYTRKPPKTIRPRPNVRVRLCSIECCFAHPLAECPRNKSFVEDIAGWSRITDQLYVWDYTTSFSNYICPFPNFDVLGPNVRFFEKHGVVGLFEQGNYSRGGGGEFSELRAYVLARLLWNPRTDVQKDILEFTDAVYGKAGPLIREYLQLLHKGVRGKEVHVKIWARPDAPYLSGDFLERAEALFDSAAERVKDQPATLRRLRKARLPIDYVRFWRTPKGDPARLKRRDAFVAACREFGITNVSEGTTLDRFAGQK